MSLMHIFRSIDLHGHLHISQNEVHLKPRADAPVAYIQFRIAVGLIRFELLENIIF